MTVGRRADVGLFVASSVKFKPNPPLLLLRRLARSVEKNGVRGAVVRSWQRLVRSLRNHGLGGTLERAFVKAPAAPVREARPPHPFDVRHGTDTGGYISGADLQGVSLSGLYVTAYAGVPPSAMTQAIADLPVRPAEFSFVDLGCGKGRALLVAAEFPFPRLLGVELATELCEAARANVASNPDSSARISILKQDATTVAYPDGPLLIFMFHPFLAPVLRKVLANLERQIAARAPREAPSSCMRGIRVSPDVMERFPFLREVYRRAAIRYLLEGRGGRITLISRRRGSRCTRWI